MEAGLELIDTRPQHIHLACAREYAFLRPGSPRRRQGLRVN
jgi:hypothetical protein